MTLETLDIARDEARLLVAADQPEFRDRDTTAQQENECHDDGNEDVPSPPVSARLLLVVAVGAVLDDVGVGQRPSSAC